MNKIFDICRGVSGLFDAPVSGRSRMIMMIIYIISTITLSIYFSREIFCSPERIFIYCLVIFCIMLIGVSRFYDFINYKIVPFSRPTLAAVENIINLFKRAYSQSWVSRGECSKLQSGMDNTIGYYCKNEIERIVDEINDIAGDDFYKRNWFQKRAMRENIENVNNIIRIIRDNYNRVPNEIKMPIQLKENIWKYQKKLIKN